MAGFEKVFLASGEGRTEYIKRRLAEGTPVATITTEINAEGMYSGPAGKSWPPSVVYAQKAKVETPAKPALDEDEPVMKVPLRPRTPSIAETLAAHDDSASVPPEYEGILNADDVADIKAEAAEAVRKAQRKKARAALLAQATQELQREAEAEMKRGRARGDMVDVGIDLAPYAPFVAIDGEVFYHGMTYRVARPVAKVLQEQMARSWLHQDSISGQKSDFNRQRSITMSARTGQVTGAEGLLR